MIQIYGGVGAMRRNGTCLLAFVFVNALCLGWSLLWLASYYVLMGLAVPCFLVADTSEYTGFDSAGCYATVR